MSCFVVSNKLQNFEHDLILLRATFTTVIHVGYDRATEPYNALIVIVEGGFMFRIGMQYSQKNRRSTWRFLSYLGLNYVENLGFWSFNLNDSKVFNL